LIRFESERKALAMMDHPNVARVLDAGTTETGRPYFVMEFVDGEPITGYADRHRLSVRDRLRLLSQACNALQHAHQKAILHRDIKPSNILVTTKDGAPLVKVIDFGVAKAIEQSASQRTLFTEVGQLIGTPEYMSPEQADGNKDIDTRSDVYSLGVVLFELLSGVLPFDSKTLRGAGYGEVCRIIREVDAPRPSAKLSSLGADANALAERRQLLPSALVQQLRSELDWIVIKSLRKERNARYASPSELAQDIENYLEDRPLTAGPESVMYRTRKFVRRNRTGVIGAACAMVLLLAGLTVSSWQAIRATRAEREIRQEQTRTIQEKQKAVEAQSQAEKARVASDTINRFLSDMLSSVDPNQAKGRDVLVRDVVDRAARYVGTRFIDQPAVESSLRETLGLTYSKLGLFDRAEEQIEAAIALEQRQHGEGSLPVILATQQLVVLRDYQGRFEEGLRLTEVNLERCMRLLGEDDQVTSNIRVELSGIYQRLNRFEEAEELLREVLATNERAGRADSEDHFMTASNLSLMLRRQQRIDEALALATRSFEGIKRIKGESDRVTLSLQGIYGEMLQQAGKPADAERVLRDQLARVLRVHGPDHMAAVMAEQALAQSIDVQGRRSESFGHFKSALEHLVNVAGATNQQALRLKMMMAGSRAMDKDYGTAQLLFDEVYAASTEVAGKHDPLTLAAHFESIRIRLVQKKWEEALALATPLYEALQDDRRVPGLPPALRAQYRAVYSIASAGSEKPDATELLEAALKELQNQDQTFDGVIPISVRVVEHLVRRANSAGRTSDAQRWQAELDRLRLPASQPAAVPD
jgi:tetratricopeptide (TPR) repeat protein